MSSNTYIMLSKYSDTIKFGTFMMIEEICILNCQNSQFLLGTIQNFVYQVRL